MTDGMTMWKNGEIPGEKIWYVLFQIYDKSEPTELLAQETAEVKAKSKELAELATVAHLRQTFANDKYRVVILTVGTRQL